MPKSKIPSPARSQGGISTPRRNKPRGSRSLCSPALSTASGRLTSVIDQFREKNLDSFALSPLTSRRSVLTDDTDIGEPRRKSWWKNLNENSRDVMEVLDDDKATASNEIENIVDIEVLSQEKKNYTLDLPESSDNESINSIVLPQRRLFTQKENQPQKKFGQLVGARETLAKLHKANTTQNDKTITAGTKDLFQGTKRSKPIFPAALLNISPNKTAADKTKENVAAEPKVPVRNIFGNRPTNKRKNIFADFIVSESEDDISEIQPKVFGFQKKTEQRRFSSVSKGRDHSPTSSITTDMELDDWKLLPSSTMVENQLDEMVAGHTPVKRARLSKLSEAKESELGTITTVDKTKQSNKSVSSKSRSSPSTKASLNNSDTIANKTAQSNKSVASKNKSRTSPRGKDATKAEENIIIRVAINKSKIEEVVDPEDDENNFTLEYENDEDIVNEELVKNAQHQTQTNKISNKSHNANIEKDKSKVQNVDCSRKSPNKTPVNKSQSKDHNKSQNMSTVNTSTNKHATKTLSRLAVEKTPGESNNISVNKNSSLRKSLNKSKLNKSVQKAHPKATKTIEESQESEQYSAQDNVDGELHNEEAGITHTKAVEEHVEQEMEVEVQESQETGAEENASKSQRNVTNEMHRVAQKEKAFENEKSNVSEDKHEMNVSQEGDATSHEQIEHQEEHTDEQSDPTEEPLEEDAKENQEVTSELSKEVNAEESEEVNAEESEEVNAEESDEVNAEETEEVDAEESEEENDEENVSQDIEESQERDTSNRSQEDNEAEASQEVDNETNENQEPEMDDEEDEENHQKVEESQEAEANESEENVSQEVDDEANDSHHEEVNQIQEHGDEVDQGHEEDDEAEEHEDVVDNEVNQLLDEDDDEVDQSQEVEDETEENEEAIDENKDNVNESQEMENTDNVNDAEERQEIENEGDEPNDSQEVEENQSEEDEDSADADRAIATDETSDEDQEEMEVDDEQNEESNNAPNVVHSEEVIEESPNVTHDTTGRNRKKIKSPEAIRHDNTNQLDSFTAKDRNTSIRKTKSMYNDLNIRPSLAPTRDSLGLSAPDSSAEGSGWDSHRTTRKTLRQTFGKDFTLRKSLRALVIEKSAKQTENMETLHSETVKFPQANSTEYAEEEYAEDSNRQDEVESDHEVSMRTRQTTLETYLQKIKQQNIENRMKMEEAIRHSLKAPPLRDTLNLFKVPSKPPPRKPKSASNKPRKPTKSTILLGELPSDVIDDMKYKPPKRFQPANASWITKRLYKFLENKLERKYDYKARVRAEKLVETIYHFVKELRRHDVASPDSVDVLKHELARLDIVKTHFEFYEFFHEFMPREVRVKVVPDIVNKIPLPRHGVFADILRGNTVQG